MEGGSTKVTYAGLMREREGERGRERVCVCVPWVGGYISVSETRQGR